MDPYTNVDKYNVNATRTLAISNLSHDTTVVNLKEMFEAFGDIIVIILSKKLINISNIFQLCLYNYRKLTLNN